MPRLLKKIGLLKKIVAKPSGTAGTAKRVNLTVLKRDEQDFSRVLARAVEVIGDRQAAARWMGTPVPSLGFATPVSLIGSKSGVKAVLNVLGQLEHGIP